MVAEYSNSLWKLEYIRFLHFLFAFDVGGLGFEFDAVFYMFIEAHGFQSEWPFVIRLYTVRA